MHPTLIVIESNMPMITTMTNQMPKFEEKEQMIQIASDEYRSKVFRYKLTGAFLENII